jgi:hypothetical protein
MAAPAAGGMDPIVPKALLVTNSEHFSTVNTHLSAAKRLENYTSMQKTLLQRKEFVKKLLKDLPSESLAFTARLGASKFTNRKRWREAPPAANPPPGMSAGQHNTRIRRSNLRIREHKLRSWQREDTAIRAGLGAGKTLHKPTTYMIRRGAQRQFFWVYLKLDTVAKVQVTLYQFRSEVILRKLIATQWTNEAEKAARVEELELDHIPGGVDAIVADIGIVQDTLTAAHGVEIPQLLAQMFYKFRKQERDAGANNMAHWDAVAEATSVVQKQLKAAAAAAGAVEVTEALHSGTDGVRFPTHAWVPLLRPPKHAMFRSPPLNHNIRYAKKLWDTATEAKVDDDGEEIVFNSEYVRQVAEADLPRWLQQTDTKKSGNLPIINRNSDVRAIIMQLTVLVAAAGGCDAIRQALARRTFIKRVKVPLAHIKEYKNKADGDALRIGDERFRRLRWQECIRDKMAERYPRLMRDVYPHSRTDAKADADGGKHKLLAAFVEYDFDATNNVPNAKYKQKFLRRFFRAADIIQWQFHIFRRLFALKLIRVDDFAKSKAQTAWLTFMQDGPSQSDVVLAVATHAAFKTASEGANAADIANAVAEAVQGAVNAFKRVLANVARAGGNAHMFDEANVDLLSNGQNTLPSIDQTTDGFGLGWVGKWSDLDANEQHKVVAALNAKFTLAQHHVGRRLHALFTHTATFFARIIQVDNGQGVRKLNNDQKGDLVQLLDIMDKLCKEVAKVAVKKLPNIAGATKVTKQWKARAATWMALLKLVKEWPLVDGIVQGGQHPLWNMEWDTHADAMLEVVDGITEDNARQVALPAVVHRMFT